MPAEADLHDGHYGHLTADPQVALRRETYDEDLGQSSWITLDEAREWFRLLGLGAGRTVLEVACGAGGMTCRMAQETGATCVGVDINPWGSRRRRPSSGDGPLLPGLVSGGGCRTAAAVFRTSHSTPSSATTRSTTSRAGWTSCETGTACFGRVARVFSPTPSS